MTIYKTVWYLYMDDFKMARFKISLYNFDRGNPIGL